MPKIAFPFDNKNNCCNISENCSGNHVKPAFIVWTWFKWILTRKIANPLLHYLVLIKMKLIFLLNCETILMLASVVFKNRKNLKYICLKTYLPRYYHLPWPSITGAFPARLIHTLQSKHIFLLGCHLDNYTVQLSRRRMVCQPVCKC